MKALKRFFNWLFRRKVKRSTPYGWHQYKVTYSYRPVRPNHMIPIIYKREKPKPESDK
jgi:hypothetical protein